MPHSGAWTRQSNSNDNKSKPLTKNEVSSWSSFDDMFNRMPKLWVTWPRPRPLLGKIICAPARYSPTKPCKLTKFEVSSSSSYRAMHFSAKRGIAIACRLSVCPSVRLSVTLVNCDHIGLGWNSSEIISPSVSLVCSLFATQTSRVYSKGNTTKFSPE